MTPLNLFESQIENLMQDRSSLKLNGEESVEIYPDSINNHDDALFFIGRKIFEKSLYIIC